MRNGLLNKLMSRALGIVALLLGAGLLLAACGSGGDNPAVTPAGPGTSQVEQEGTTGGNSGSNAASTTGNNDPRSKGPADAPVTIVEYSDYQCPFCSRWVADTYPMILKDYIDAGKVRLEFRDFPLGSIHPNADDAAVAARCAGEQGAYFEMHDLLFAGQNDWANLADPAEFFAGYAAEIGLDGGAFGECQASGRYDAAIQADLQAGQAAGVSGTPSFVINGELIVGAQPAAVFQAGLDRLLDGQTFAVPTPTVDPAALPKPVDISIAGAPMKGDPDAPMTIVEYSDYQCPFCARFFNDTMGPLVQEFIDSGKAKLVFKDFPLNSIHPQALEAAEAARCVWELAGGDEAYWQMHDMLFAGQQAWSGKENAADIFAGYAKELGADEAAFRECIASDKYVDAVRSDFEEGAQFGVNGTPTFFIDGQIFVGAQPIDNFRRAIATVAEGGNIIPPPQPTPAPAPTPAPLSEAIPLENAAGIEGDPDAPVVIVEYSDYQCPFCQRHFQQTMPELEKYIEDGTVLYVFKDFPLTSIHPQAPKAAEAARCAGDQEAYWQMHDLLFANQQQWSGRPDAVSTFKNYAGQLSLDQAAFDACLDGDTYAEAVNANLMEGVGYGVQGTPGFFINRERLPGAYPIQAFQQLIQAELQD